MARKNPITQARAAAKSSYPKASGSAKRPEKESPSLLKRARNKSSTSYA
jgi:hypothetical protein